MVWLVEKERLLYVPQERLVGNRVALFSTDENRSFFYRRLCLSQEYEPYCFVNVRKANRGVDKEWIQYSTTPARAGVVEWGIIHSDYSETPVFILFS